MNTLKKAALGGFILACLLLAGSRSTWSDTADAKKAVIWTASDIKWMDSPAFKGAKIAVLWGDPKTGGYGALKSIPGGQTLQLHTHSYDQKVLILSGTIVLAVEGSAPKELSHASFAFIPAGVRHTADCKSGADCVYFEEQPGATDIKFVEKSPK